MPGKRKSAWQQCCHADAYSAPLAAAMLVPYGPTWPHLTHSCGTKNVPAALSLLPYQRGDRDFKPQSLVRISAKSLILIPKYSEIMSRLEPLSLIQKLMGPKKCVRVRRLDQSGLFRSLGRPFGPPAAAPVAGRAGAGPVLVEPNTFKTDPPNHTHG